MTTKVPKVVLHLSSKTANIEMRAVMIRKRVDNDWIVSYEIQSKRLNGERWLRADDFNGQMMDHFHGPFEALSNMSAQIVLLILRKVDP